MAQELMYTSVPRGLLPGSQGFCTVAATRGMQPPLIEKLESLTGYKQLFAPNDAHADQNPVGYFHFRMTLGGRSSHILGRIGAAPIDYSGRTNKFAHLVVLDSNELPDCGPAALLLDPSFLQSSWDGSPEWIDEPKRIPQFDQPASFCRYWQQVTGDAGWAGALLHSYENAPHQPVFLLYEPGEDQTALALIAEALALLPPEERWSIGFSTYPSNLGPGITCPWRGAVSGFADVKGLQRTGGLVWPMNTSLGRAEDNPLTRAAREGRPAPRERRKASAGPAPIPRQGSFSNLPASGGSNRPPAMQEAPRLSGLVNSPPPMDDNDDVRVIEEEPRSRPRSTPRREDSYSRESSSPPERKKGSGMFLGIVIGSVVMLLMMIVIEMAAQQGTAQMLGMAGSGESRKNDTKEKVEPEPKEQKSKSEEMVGKDQLAMVQKTLRDRESSIEVLEKEKKDLLAEKTRLETDNAQKQMKIDALQTKLDVAERERKEPEKKVVEGKKEPKKEPKFSPPEPLKKHAVISFSEAYGKDLDKALEGMQPGHELAFDLKFPANKMCVKQIPKSSSISPNSFNYENNIHFDYTAKNPDLSTSVPIFPDRKIKELLRVEISGRYLKFTPHLHFAKLPDQEKQEFFSELKGYLFQVPSENSDSSGWIYFDPVIKHNCQVQLTQTKLPPNDEFGLTDLGQADNKNFKFNLTPRSEYTLSIPLGNIPSKPRLLPDGKQMDLQLEMSIEHHPVTCLGTLKGSSNFVGENTAANQVKAEKGEFSWRFARLNRDKDENPTSLVLEYSLKRNKSEDFDHPYPKKNTTELSEKEKKTFRSAKIEKELENIGGIPQLEFSPKRPTTVHLWLRPDPKAPDVRIPLLEIVLTSGEIKK
jgi:hypothetical protein